MNDLNQLLAEFRQELSVTRRFLAAVPFSQRSFKPHPNSENLITLAVHIAEIVGWWTSCIEDDSLDFKHFVRRDIQNNEELLAYFDQLRYTAEQSILNANPALLNQHWAMTDGETTHFSLPKWQVLRVFCMNHLIHHRAQLGVYLRILEIPVPATYGPSADDYEVLLIEKF